MRYADDSCRSAPLQRVLPLRERRRRASTPQARLCGCLHELDQHTLADQERGVVRGDDHLDDTLGGSFVAGVRLQLALPERAGNAQDPTACNLCGIGLRDDLRRLTDVDVGQRTLDDLGADDVGAAGSRSNMSETLSVEAPAPGLA